MTNPKMECAEELMGTENLSLEAGGRTPPDIDPCAPAESGAGSLMDHRVCLLVAVGSAMAAGCEPCLDQIIPNLISAGVDDQDIRRAVELGNQVRRAATDYMREVADVLTGTRLAENPFLAGGDRPPEQGSDCGCG